MVPQPSEFEKEQTRFLRHNFLVNILDGGFFGAGLGFASFTTILPLFVSSLTHSAILIGLIPAIHNMGWQLPQLLTAQSITRLKEYKPTVMILAIQERLPFLGLAIVAWIVPLVSKSLALTVIFFLLIWQGLGGGFTANPWQNLIARIIPSPNRATFFGLQTSASSLFASIGAVIAGFILEQFASPLDFSLCFLTTGFLMACSWYSLKQTREPACPDITNTVNFNIPLHQSVWKILRKDKPFGWLLITKMLYQFVTMAFAFYTVYAVQKHGMTVLTVGILTSVLFITQVVANPLVGWIADRWNKRYVMAIGTLVGAASAFLARLAPSPEWFFMVIILDGLSITAYWTVTFAVTLDFGQENDRPVYIGLANTLVAPATIVAPILGGWIADSFGYQTTFLMAAIAGIVTTIILLLVVTDPVHADRNT